MGYEFDKAVVLYALRQLDNPGDRDELEAWIGAHIMARGDFVAYLAGEIELEAMQYGLHLYAAKGRDFECVVDQLLIRVKDPLEHPAVEKIVEYKAHLRVQRMLGELRPPRRSDS